MTDASDIPIDHWVNRHLPENWRPYARLMRLDRPIGSWLLLLPCWWGLALGWRAGPEATDVWEIARLYLLFSVGAVVMRGAGCAVNDLWDRDFDAKVARTINRPIAYGDLSVKQALGFLVVLLLIGLAILLQLNQASWILGSHLQLGRVDGLGGGHRHPRLALRGVVLRRHRLDPGL
jgi:4-hydroxybenzoate polyprenyltransferase